jgi:hypothetical protein
MDVALSDDSEVGSWRRRLQLVNVLLRTILPFLLHSTPLFPSSIYSIPLILNSLSLSHSLCSTSVSPPPTVYPKQLRLRFARRRVVQTCLLYDMQSLHDLLNFRRRYVAFEYPRDSFYLFRKPLSITRPRQPCFVVSLQNHFCLFHCRNSR